LILLVLIVYRLGYVDRYVAVQIKDTFAQYGIRPRLKIFTPPFRHRRWRCWDWSFYDAQTGAKLGKIDRLLATVRVEDLYALNLQRNINLKDLKIEGLEAWVHLMNKAARIFATSMCHRPSPTAASCLPIHGPD